MARHTSVWKSNISFTTKHKVYRSLVISSVLYSCETCTLHAETERRIQAFETKCVRRLLRISYRENKTNEFVRSKVNFMAGEQEPLQASSHCKMEKDVSWYGHIIRHDSLGKTILQCTLKGERRRARQQKCWSDNIKDWTSLTMPELLRVASNRDEWKGIGLMMSVPVCPLDDQPAQGMNE